MIVSFISQMHAHVRIDIRLSGNFNLNLLLPNFLAKLHCCWQLETEELLLHFYLFHTSEHCFFLFIPRDIFHTVFITISEILYWLGISLSFQWIRPLFHVVQRNTGVKDYFAREPQYMQTSIANSFLLNT